MCAIEDSSFWLIRPPAISSATPFLRGSDARTASETPSSALLHSEVCAPSLSWEEASLCALLGVVNWARFQGRESCRAETRGVRLRCWCWGYVDVDIGSTAGDAVEVEVEVEVAVDADGTYILGCRGRTRALSALRAPGAFLVWKLAVRRRFSSVNKKRLKQGIGWGRHLVR